MRDERSAARDEGPETVVHHLQVEALQVEDVAGDVQRQDLPLAVWQHLVAAEESLDDETALARPVAFAQDIHIGRYLSQRHRQVQNGLLLLLRQRGDALQLPEEAR